MGTDIQRHEEYERLKTSISALRKELVELVSDREHLFQVVIPNINMDYVLTFGEEEAKVYEAYCLMLRLQRKVDMIQERINREEPVDIEEIERRLDVEFEAYQQKLRQMFQAIQDAKLRKESTFLTVEESNLLKRLYREIVKALHPDVNPEITDKQLRLFHMANEAYQSGDLETLRMIYELISGLLEEDEVFDFESMSHMRLEIERLTKMKEEIEEEMREAKAGHPYNKKELLRDLAKQKVYYHELYAYVQHYETAISNLKDKIERMCAT